MSGVYFKGADRVKIKKLGGLDGGQDGASEGGYLFRFSRKGDGKVYRCGDDFGYVGDIVLHGALVPHSNTVFFGSEYYASSDEFPILYSNVYNNYAEHSDRHLGVLLAYRIEHTGAEFSGRLVQVIKIGFCNDALWQSEGREDARPYGNFLLDRERESLYAYVMRDGERQTRFFAFNMPSVHSGEMSTELGVPIAVLDKDGITDMFDSEYINYMQGGTLFGGCLYSAEGFRVKSDMTNLPAIRVFDLREHRQAMYIDLYRDFSLEHEPELLDVIGGKLIYADVKGNAYQVEFK